MRSSVPTALAPARPRCTAVGLAARRGSVVVGGPVGVGATTVDASSPSAAARPRSGPACSGIGVPGGVDVHASALRRVGLAPSVPADELAVGEDPRVALADESGPRRPSRVRAMNCTITFVGRDLAGAGRRPVNGVDAVRALPRPRRAASQVYVGSYPAWKPTWNCAMPARRRTSVALRRGTRTAAAAAPAAPPRAQSIGGSAVEVVRRVASSARGRTRRPALSSSTACTGAVA